MTKHQAKPLKEAVRDHVEARRLSDERFEALMAMQRAHQQEATREEASSPQAARRRPWLWVSAAAVILAVVSMWWLWPQGLITDQIASEVARNHMKLKPLEVESGDLGQVRQFFVELDFALVDSKPVSDRGWQLRGGRYCSIQGQEAAQLRVHDPQTGSVRSIYMAAYDPEHFGVLPRVDQGQSPMVTHARGLEVEIWVEQDVLIVTAGAP